MIYLFTDYGYQGPYVGEVKAILDRGINLGQSVIDLMHDAPEFNPRASSYLLAALARQFSTGDACLAIVDPGVGSIQRRPVLIVADDIIYCGPDNGLFSIVIQNAESVICYEINYNPELLTRTFHGRDLFAPELIKYLNNDHANLERTDKVSLVGVGWPDDLDEVIYFDSFGNAITGRRGDKIAKNTCLMLNGIKIKSAKTFSAVEKNEPFWYTNSMGLVEIGVNQASAKAQLRLNIGQLIEFAI